MIMNYSEQIKSPMWQKKRLEIMEMFGFKCEICGDDSTELNIHHVKYVTGRKIHEYNSDELMCLCKKCHEKIHSNVLDFHKISHFIFTNDCDISIYVNYNPEFLLTLSRSINIYFKDLFESIIINEVEEGSTFVIPILGNNKSYVFHISSIDFDNKLFYVKQFYTLDV